MRRYLRTRSKKRVKKTTPGGRKVLHFKKKKTSYHHCGECDTKLNKPRLGMLKAKKTAKTKKRPERPYANLCSKCMRAKIKSRLR